MARTNATNFTAPLQFPYATAGTDIFKKEDVQTLAQAVDQHDHSAGKGLTVSVAGIPAGAINGSQITDNTITSAKITDGTIQAVDIADGAISSAKIADGTIVTADIADSQITSAKIADGTIQAGDLAIGAATSINFAASLAANSTTSTSPVLIPSHSLTLTLVGGAVHLCISTSLYNSAGANGAYLFCRVDSGGWNAIAYANLVAGAVAQMVVGQFWWYYGALSSASHTFDIGWQTTGGTLVQNAATNTIFGITEFRR
jgi:hypothetical protein